MEILNRALLIGDAHWGVSRPEFLDVLIRIERGEIAASQLFLLGDMTDLLMGGFPFLEEVNRPVLAVLQRISRKMPVIYFEGNHDFLLAALLPDAIVVPLERQPMMFSCRGKFVALSHGDWDGPWHYRLYSMLVRRRWMLRILHVVTGNFVREWFVRWLLARQTDKRVCRAIDHFPAIVERKMRHPFYRNAGTVIEGHFHQDYRMYHNQRLYVNLPAFACAQEGLRVRCDHDDVFFEKVKLTEP